MALLALTGSLDLDPDEKAPLFADLPETYAEFMDSTTRYLTVVYHERGRSDQWPGRASRDADMVVLEADVRRGRFRERRREFAVAFGHTLRDAFGLPRENLKVVFMERGGSHMRSANASVANGSPTPDGRFPGRHDSGPFLGG